MRLGALLEAGTVEAAEIRGAIDALPDDERSHVCLALSPPQQRRLWQVASGGPTHAGGEFVSGGTAVFAGRNSLRVFSRFEKWFSRQDGQVVGCNRHPLSALIGPGYFSVRGSGGAPGPVEFDYGQIPLHAPAGWPPVRDNARGLARPVYGDLVDRVVWVAQDVLIGAAFRRGAPLDSYFVLVRKTG